MNYTKIFLLLVLVSGFSFAQADIQWLEESAGDLRATSLEANARSVPASLHHETASLNFAWGPDQNKARGISASEPTPATGQGAVAESRQFWLDANGDALARGIDLPLSAPGAVIRISALESGSRISLDPAQLDLHLNGRSITAQFGPDEFSTGQDLREQGMRVPEDTLAFRLNERVGAGTLTVSIGGVPADQSLVIHVYEPNSPWVARLSLPRHNFLSGQALDFDLTLSNGRQSLDASSVQAVLVSPDAGQTWPIQTGRNNQLSLGTAPLAARSQPGQGLYEAHVYVEGKINGQTIRRDLTLALNIAPAIARFSGEAHQGRTSGLAIELGVETAVGGRYQVNAELMGTDARGQLQPLGFVQSAAVLGQGRGMISIEIDQDLIRGSGLTAPFEVHNLQLLDQGRMYLLEHRERALLISH